ncbi:FecCD family ABC transporter permease [Roseibium algae]|uniref:Iron ABC transporter permease n=1 Tax=Roseibium algae TaxID=3123038 RepID=A0ABU8TQV4_9HYPH
MSDKQTAKAASYTKYAPREDRVRLAALSALFCMLPAAAIWSVGLGATAISFKEILDAIFAFDGSRDHLVITTIRIPRALAGILAGGGLAISGAIMQAITNNPLASPSLLGVNAGAAFAVVLTLSFFGAGASHVYIWSAFGGAAIAAVLVYVFGSIGPRHGTQIKLVLTGAVLTAFLTSLTTALLIFDQSALDSVRLWTAGSLSGRTMTDVQLIAPYMLVGIAMALAFPRHLAAMSLGADVAKTLGQNPVVWRAIAITVVILLAGGAVALAGPVGFVGLVVPHIIRFTVGPDFRWTIPFNAISGALLVITADSIGRVLFASQDFPVGVTMALIGAPFFIWLARACAEGSS